MGYHGDEQGQRYLGQRYCDDQHDLAGVIELEVQNPHISDALGLFVDRLPCCTDQIPSR